MVVVVLALHVAAWLGLVVVVGAVRVGGGVVCVAARGVPRLLGLL